MKSAASAGITGIVVGATLALALATAPDGPPHPEARSAKWPAARAAHLKLHPTCEVCGTKKDLEVHHVQPFHEHPERELDPDNLITLCASPSCKSHLTVGHLGNYQRSNPHIREDAALLKKRRQEN